jgi:tetratricopeptide (TPR) repeat protein
LENEKMMRLSILTVVVIMSTLLSTACTENGSEELMPLTTDSELALKFYETGVVALDQLKLDLASNNFEMAIKEDPDFFMSYFWLYIIAHKDSKDIADKALQTNAPLNKAEQQIKKAFRYLLDGQVEKVTENIQVAIDLYPSDPHVHKSLYLSQYFVLKDMEGALKTMNRAIEERPDFASTYNYLGYAQMYLEEFDKAEAAFNKYIKLAPDQANPYDSKGDFYMYTEQYDKAYENYMKAFEIDSSSFAVSRNKARKAKRHLEKLEN